MIEIGTERIKLIGRQWLNGWIRWVTQPTTVTDLTPEDGDGHMYVAEDADGLTHIYFKNDGGEEFDLCHLSGSSSGGSTTIINNNITNIEGEGDHLHGLAEWIADGSTTVFYTPDFYEYLEWVNDNGSHNDPREYTDHANRDRITFSAAPTAGNVILAEYVIARI